ncbi:hypothetical protein [Burkholderia cepacia]|uniref:hypothetical protein n=1 Tax=Burkholderia cepacia TaxID=292 RepID=UPI000A762E3F|nr:hypothetical protein [Burkholderia cepacia]
MKIYIDEHGFIHPELAEGNEILGDFLSGDIQGSVYAADEYINACRSVERADAKRWEGTGNAHTVIIENGCVEILNEYTGKSLKIKNIENFRAYVDVWKEYLLSMK